jgi:cell division protein FtsW (lipid II flippase)
MLTGDNYAIATALATQAGITDVHAELRPEDKASLIAKMWAERSTAVVGDSANDAPALPVTLLLLALLVLQPDLGGAVSLGIVMLALLSYAQAPARLLLALTGGAVAGAVIGLSTGYRASRITAFLSPNTTDPLGGACQST